MPFDGRRPCSARRSGCGSARAAAPALVSPEGLSVASCQGRRLAASRTAFPADLAVLQDAAACWLPQLFPGLPRGVGRRSGQQRRADWRLHDLGVGPGVPRELESEGRSNLRVNQVAVHKRVANSLRPLSSKEQSLEQLDRDVLTGRSTAWPPVSAACVRFIRRGRRAVFVRRSASATTVPAGRTACGEVYEGHGRACSRS